DGTWSGGPAGLGRDGGDFTLMATGMAGAANETDIEVMESWYPLLVHERKYHRGVNGAGAYRSGGGSQMSFSPYGGAELSGEMLGLREAIPLEGAAGGYPGATTEYWIYRADNTKQQVSTKASGIVLHEGDTFEYWSASGGGVGDPLDRSPEAVA